MEQTHVCSNNRFGGFQQPIFANVFIFSRHKKTLSLEASGEFALLDDPAGFVTKDILHSFQINLVYRSGQGALR